MYSRCVRRAVSRPLSRQRLPNLLRIRCLATAEPTPTPADAAIPPAAFTTKDSENSTSGATDPISFKLPEHVTWKDVIESEVPSSDSPASFFTSTEGHEDVECLRFYGIHVMPEAKLLNMPGILAVVRELEKRFGRIMEFRILRDKDSPSDYMKALFINFNDEASVRKVQETFHGAYSGTIMVGAPPGWDRRRELDGGVSLQDVQAYLRPARPQTDAEKENEGDKRLGKVVSSVEEALDSTEAEAEAEAELPKPEDADPFTTAAVDGCECRIEVLSAGSKAFANQKPYFLEKRANPKLRAHISRSLIQWGGFYPHHRFASSPHEDDGLGTNGKAAENSSDMTEEEAKRAETIRIAAHAMRSLLVRARTRLRDLGAPDHGLEMREGKKIVLDWETGTTSGGAWDAANAAVKETNGHAKVNAEGADTAQNQSNLAKTKWAKPKALTPEEEESLDRLFALSNDRRNGRRIQPEAKVSSPAAKTTQVSTKATPSSLPPSSSKTQTTSNSTLKAQARATPKAKAHSIPPTASTASHVRQPVVTKEVENNRARRAMRKAEQDERAGFKAKLLGWLGR